MIHRPRRPHGLSPRAALDRTLRLVLRRGPDPWAHDEVGVSAPAHGSLVEFVAYAEDCLLSGHVRLDADRLTDLLNGHNEYVLVDALVESLADSHAVEVKEVMVGRDELFLVHAVGPRGDPARRKRTRQHPLALQLGPYHVRGYFHGPPGSDPIAALRRRKPMVPLTEAWVEYQSGSVRQRRRVGTLVVNREQLDWVVEAKDEEVELPDLPLEFVKGPLLKDFTGDVFVAHDAPTDEAATA
jgi:hypothetical protein